MDPLCEVCGMARAVVYCRSDTARLCLNCDAHVHSANALSGRHLRSLICDRCHSQPAIVRCLEDKMSLCQSCDWNGHGCSGPGHPRHVVNCYSGCPSPPDLFRISSSVIDASSLSEVDTKRGLPGMVSIKENCVSNCWKPGENGSSVGLAIVPPNVNCVNYKSQKGPSSGIPPNVNPVPDNEHQLPIFPKETDLSKSCSPFKDFRICDGDDLYEGLNMNDVGLDFENSDEKFGCSQGLPGFIFEDVGMARSFVEKNLLVVDSSGPNDNAIEASSSGQHDCLALQSSCIAGSGRAVQGVNGSAVILDSSGNRNINLCFPTGQVHSSMSLSLSNLTGESSCADYQDCGVSPIFLTCESPWDSNLESNCPQERDSAMMRHDEKKRNRTFRKQIRSASRKARTDTRKRVKGQFVKVGEAYDFDPLETRNC